MLVAIFCVFAILSYQLAGTVGYIYLTDICLQTGISVSIFFLNFSLTITSVVVPIMFYSPKVGVGATFIMLDIISFLGLLFCVIFLRETKGLTDDECKSIYNKKESNGD